MSGPFAGQRIVSSTSWSSPTPKLVGTYELELTEAVEEAIAGCPTTVVVIGAAEGYYAIGFARRLPGADVLAFDTDPKARRICRQSAVDNAVQDRVQIHGHCTPKQLQSVVGFDCLVFMDCEGCELELLDPTESPGLRSSRIIVELHDFIVPGARERISARFDSSHHVQVITAQQRRPSDFPLLDELDGETAYRALDEGRPTEPHPMEWLSMVPKNC